jgi:asparagine synthase (glutamine-hydrolysing)
MEMIVQRRYRELFHTLQGNVIYRFLRLIKMEWRRNKTQNFRLPVFNPRFYETFKQRWPHQIVRDDLVRRYNLEERYFDTARFDAGYIDLKRFTLEKRWQPFVPTRMENCTLMAAGRKIEYRWPLLDIRLVRLFLSIPSEENYYRGMGRYLHRRAIDGVVPKLVAWKQGKDMGSVIVPNQVAATHLSSMSAPDPHPALAEYIDTDRWKQQSGQLRSNLDGGMDDARRFQFNMNYRAVTNLSEWLKLVDLSEKDSTLITQ